MDSLLANYASSDEEEDQQQQQPPKRTALPPKPSSQPSSSSSLFSSLPKPKPQNPSFFQSLPKPKQTLIPKSPNLDDDDDEDPIASIPTSKPSSVFSLLPPPKSRIPIQPITNLSSSEQNPKRIVQFNPPINSFKYDEDEDDDVEEERRHRKASESSAQKLSAKSFLSSLSAPRYSATLGASAGLGSVSGRRAIVETETVGSGAESNAGMEQNVASYEIFQSNSEQGAVNYEGYGGYENYQSTIDQNAVNYESHGGYEGYRSGVDQNVDVGVQLQAGVSGSDASDYGNFGGYAGYEQQYGNDWVGGSATVVPAIPVMGEIKGSKKRGRNEVPTEIIEVKQDELMKNRPREDQAKLTGIAFGPSYQPVSTKAKPTKLHKRKHQIGSLYFDMKQKEMELAERRSRGFLTKAETHAKYGW